MAEPRDTLGKIQAVANIAAAIVIPLLIAYVGWIVQVRESDSNASSEFVGMALKILADESKTASPELKTWAIAIIDSKSPVPLSKGLSSAILSGQTRIQQYLPAPKEFMASPLPLPEFTGKTNGDLVQYLLDLQYAYQVNSVNHEALIKWLKQIDEDKK